MGYTWPKANDRSSAPSGEIWSYRTYLENYERSEQKVKSQSVERHLFNMKRFLTCKKNKISKKKTL